MRTGIVLGGLGCALGTWLLANLDTIVLLAWVIAAVISLTHWTKTCELLRTSPTLIRAAAIAMLTCLLASGSWQAPGIGVPLLVLIACSEVRRSRCAIGTVSSDPTEPAPRLNPFPLVLAALGLVCFAVQAWRPVTSSWMSLLRAETVAPSNLQQSLQFLDDAIRQDPLDSDLLGRRAAKQVELALTSPSGLFEVRASASVASLDHWLQQDRFGFTNWQRAGDLAFSLYAHASQQRMNSQAWLDKTIECYAEAVRQYPSSTGLRVQLALSLAFAKDWDKMKAELDVAERISRDTPHLDKKLANQSIWFPQGVSPDSFRIPNSGSVSAEPLVSWLRNLPTAKDL